MIDTDRLINAYHTACRDLLAERDAAGHWVGELSGSSLSTATAVSALAVVCRQAEGSRAFDPSYDELIARGLGYLARNQNPDGGWGDTDRSLSNIATTMLAQAAFHLAGAAEHHSDLLGRAQRYVDREGGLPALRRRYGKDKTFAVPILANCALAGMASWEEVSALPFELACVPFRRLRFLRLPVVSYAIPALVAIGQARYFHRKPLGPMKRLVRGLARNRSLSVLEKMQPASGGFLEATPLTSFVVMSLAGSGKADHPVVRRGVMFLTTSARPDGSWPIDTNLATWVTTLAINALAAAGEDVGRLECFEWLLSCQQDTVHPMTDAAPGGWGWSDLQGAVPDVDDTAGALLALAALCSSAGDKQAGPLDQAASAGLRWLLNLQNADGGWPTFCRGWGRLPFDRSGADLTAHAVRAIRAWEDVSEVWTAEVPRARAGVAVRKGLAYLSDQQRDDGSWVPLWFGNQHHPAEQNPVYGTARVLLAYRDLGLLESRAARRGLSWLAANRNTDGGWGGVGRTRSGSGPIPCDNRIIDLSSVEETALALEALVAAAGARSARPSGDPTLEPAIHQGLAWLAAAVESGRHREQSPIGFYFARLWYYERLYPLIFSVAALGSAVHPGGTVGLSNRDARTALASQQWHAANVPPSFP